ncbi:conserved hypothetical protein [Sulfurovum sp. enrichment culture clone C5]|uniref:GmrSD restriction endonucleases N-terminal domain-containing protein n=1 Tax=Sulfurovum sp. enrichment culture clone C5 TaxID=497650 RepID=A0A0S4XKX5_9BACT|nr:conserved hypothetical protein [Sulfurovum sp. enrichment culture clone C5]
MGGKMDEKLKLKSIYELLYNEEGKPESFFIPSYQRGYRWTTQQVKELLEDIWEFTSKRNKQDGEFYCLQPIVVKKSKNLDHKWDVLDGQQRLTTIYIILKFLEKEVKDYFYIDNLYTINYETRLESGEFLSSFPNVKDEDKYIDFFHMKKTYDFIEKWFHINKIHRIDFLNVLLKHKIEDNGGKIKDIENNIRVIWYEVEAENELLNTNNKYHKDIEIFTRINMGKIPLTNAELIKALLIQGYDNNEITKENRQFELASEWDFIEYSLQNDDFWYFINKDKNEKATKIEFIFELIAEKYFNENQEELEELRKSQSIDKYYEFHLINHYLQNDKRNAEEKKKETIYEKLWSEVKNYFRILNEWYEDREFFHKIGFLVIYSQKTMLDFIAEYTKENSTKTEFRKFLDNDIKKIFKKIDIENLTYRETNVLRKVLLMFNIQTILDNKKANLRFQFDRYKEQDWDIEHIRSKTDKYPKTEKEKSEWISDIKDKNTKSKEEVLRMEEKEFNSFFDNRQKEFEGDDALNKDDIGNLALLDLSTNRSYGNAFFAIKRYTIIENDKNGTFIPICTKNVFLKYYSENATDLQKWTKDDAEKYKSAIVTTLKNYVNGVKGDE